MAKGMTEEEWRDLNDLRQYWHMACDCDPFPGADTFMERMHDRGYARLRRVTKADLQEEAFAAERGIEKGGYIWTLTTKGARALAGQPAPAPPIAKAEGR